MANYSHPHETYVLNDNTKLTTTSSINAEPFLFQPFFSSDGEDGKILEFTDKSKVLSTYGEPNMSLYGQSYYQVLNWLTAGGSVKGIRLTAKNATYANMLLMLDVKITETQKVNASNEPLYKDPAGAETTISSGNTPIMIKKATVKHRYESFTNITNNAVDIKTLMRTKYTKDEDGTIHYPLFCTVCNGKGTYGNKYRTRLVPATQKDKSTTYRNYTFELYKNDNGLVLDKGAPINIAAYPFAKNVARQSVYFEDVINMNGFPVKVYGLDDMIEAAMADIAQVVSQDTEVEAKDIDIFTFYNRNGNIYNNVTIQQGSVDLTALQGHGLSAGDDGDFANTNPNRWDAMYERLADLFKGNVDPTILDKKEQRFKVTLDANYPLEVKKLMVSWRNTRDTEPLVLDSSLMYSVANLKSYLKEDLMVDNFGIFINTQNFDTYDEYSGKNITVTSNYLWALLLPAHFNNRGSQIPFAGVDIPLDRYIIDGSLRPVISDDQDKSDIYDLRGNYIERESGSYIFATNITSQSYESELLYTNNVFVYYEIKQDLSSLSAIFRFKFSDSDNDLNTLNKLANSKIEKYLEAKCKAISVEVVNNTSDPTGKSVKTLAKVGFKNFDLNNDIVVDIDRY